MVPLTLNATDMKALVSYVTSLGGTSSASASGIPGRGIVLTSACRSEASVANYPLESTKKGDPWMAFRAVTDPGHRAIDSRINSDSRTLRDSGSMCLKRTSDKW